jgi:hypothetical protein
MMALILLLSPKLLQFNPAADSFASRHIERWKA